MEATQDAAYDTTYHPKVRGRLWNALRDTAYDEHDSEDPTGFCFSNIFPWGEIDEGDYRHLLIASAREGPLAHMAADLLDDREFNIGEMGFEVVDVSERHVDVGEPGTTGTLETTSGVFAKVPPHHRTEEHGNDPYWREEDGLGAFMDYIEYRLNEKVERFLPDYIPLPTDEERLFDGYSFQKQYSLPTEVAVKNDSKQVLKLLLSKWEFKYTVRDDTHRKHLNLALDTGIGGRCTLGFGFLVKEGAGKEAT